MMRKIRTLAACANGNRGETFNVVIGQVTIDSSPFQLMFGTIGAALPGLAGGLVAGIGPFDSGIARIARRREFKPYAVGECWDSERTIGDWPDEANAWSDNPVGAFDFPLHWRLRDFFATVTASGGADEEKDH